MFYQDCQNLTDTGFSVVAIKTAVLYESPTTALISIQELV
jgi:hypothetical protein